MNKEKSNKFLDISIIIIPFVTFLVLYFLNSFSLISSFIITYIEAIALSSIILIIAGFRTKKSTEEKSKSKVFLSFSLLFFVVSYIYVFSLQPFDDYIDNTIVGWLIALGSGFIYKGLEHEWSIRTHLQTLSRIAGAVLGLHLSVTPLVAHFISQGKVFAILEELVGHCLTASFFEHTSTVFIGIGTAIIFTTFIDKVGKVTNGKKTPLPLA